MRLSLAREVLKQLLGAAPQLLGEVHVDGLRAKTQVISVYQRYGHRNGSVS